MEKKRMLSLHYIQPLIDNKFFHYMKIVDTQITKNFRLAGVLTRPVPHNGNGLWCCLLLPVILLNYCLLYNVGLVYRLVAYISLGLLFYSLLFITFIYLSTQVVTECFVSGCTVSIFIATIPIYCFLDFGIFFSLGVSTAAVLLYCYILHLAVTRGEKTFTVGEAMIVCQGCTLFLTASGIDAYLQIFHPEMLHIDDETFFVNGLIVTALSTVGLIVAALIVLSDEFRDLRSVYYIVASAISYGLILLHYTHGAASIPRFFYYIFRNPVRVCLFFTWLGLLAIAVLVVYFRTEMGDKATSVMRKSFHILGSLVFITGILNDVQFISLAAGLGLALLILTESLRVSNIEPVSSVLQSAFDVFSDEKDCGLFAMTPIYLYCGLACPLALVPPQSKDKLVLLSGVLSIGIGDSAASWFGERYGRTHWPDCERTVEGTACNVFSQVFMVYVLEFFELLDANSWWFRAGLAGAVSGLVESQTDQVDNLILPLVTIIAFQATCFAV